MNLKTIDGKKTAIINMFIDPENGFQTYGLKDDDGGVLYVPHGEEVSPIMGEIITESRDTIFILGQDYHPRNHISFMVNHPGLMEYRIDKFKDFLAEHGQEIPDDEQELYEMAQQPVHFFDGMDSPPVAFPFDEIVLNEDRDIIGVKEQDGRIREVEVTTTSGLEPNEHDRGRITKVLDTYLSHSFDQFRQSGSLLSTQTLWTVHCVQGTKSSLYPPEMNLPEGLKDKLDGDLKKNVIFHRDADTGNTFWVVRKGDKSEVDSYGIGVENDAETLTEAMGVFREIAKDLKRSGCEQVIINGGGLATNFCVEFSMNNVDDFLAGFFKMAGMDVALKYVPEISRGIPIPGGAEVPFSLDGTEGRLKERGIDTSTVAEILAMTREATTPRLTEDFTPKGLGLNNV